MVQIRSFFWSVFSRIRTEYRKRYFASLRIHSECGKIRTRKNYVFGHISHSVQSKQYFFNVPECLSVISFSIISNFFLSLINDITILNLIIYSVLIYSYDVLIAWPSNKITWSIRLIFEFSFDKASFCACKVVQILQSGPYTKEIFCYKLTSDFSWFRWNRFP